MRGVEYQDVKMYTEKGVPVTGYSIVQTRMLYLNCLSVEHCVWGRVSDHPPIYSPPIKFVFDTKKIPKDVHLFRINRAVGTIFCSHYFRKKVESLGLEGLVFYEHQAV